MHAVAPVHPIQPSPYSPSSRRHTNPVYLRVTATKEYLEADAATKAAVDALKPDEATELIDYDKVWDAKIAALELIKPREPRQGDDFATYCALAEVHGADYREWPAELRHPDNPAVREQADPARVSFHAWLQELCDRQLEEARLAAEDMTVGIVHDLPVGVDPGGADAWALQDVLATGVTVGAPPDAFNQQGQNWSLPPWHPRKLAEAGYRPYRDLLRAVFRHSQGLRIDHIAGLWRLWWIPGGDARRGTYVRYDADAMTGILALEAHRAGASVIGEDLGTVESVVTETLHANNMLSSAVLWFERDGNGDMLPSGTGRSGRRAASAPMTCRRRRDSCAASTCGSGPSSRSSRATRTPSTPTRPGSAGSCSPSSARTSPPPKRTSSSRCTPTWPTPRAGWCWPPRTT